ncbi:MAG: beta-lactamase family protein [Rhodothermaceae bacterium]|nr:beta-lactamase family protein [Rhodothermaceae bacterium]MYF62867.1 beta-lactamase family protein [Rhodothermaceae bacterium]MYI83975.1 beta-lactamase family protein [Rhodothermaceae bacterium]
MALRNVIPGKGRLKRGEMLRTKLLLGPLMALILPGCGADLLTTAPEDREEGSVHGATLDSFSVVHGIGASALAIMKDGNVIYEGVSGFMDAGHDRAIISNVMMRVASVSKPVTAAAVRQLINDGALSLRARAFDLGQPEGGVLNLQPFPMLGDSRLMDITVEHLLLHRSGWDRDSTADWVFREVSIARRMSVPSPPGRENTVRYILGQPLQFDPGSKTVYSNVGYLVLGLIIEKVSGKDYLTYVRENIFAPLGISAEDVIQARTFPEDRSMREPWYDAPALTHNVFDPNGPRVRWPDGGWHAEAKLAEAGLVSTTRALLEFADEYVVWGSSIGRLRSSRSGSSWWSWHGGTLPGTNSLVYQSGDGVSYVVLFNRRAITSDGLSYVKQFMEILNARLMLPSSAHASEVYGGASTSPQ